MTLFHVDCVHGSGPNTTAGRRLGLAIRYVAPSVRALPALELSAVHQAERTITMGGEGTEDLVCHPSCPNRHLNRRMLRLWREPSARLFFDGTPPAPLLGVSIGINRVVVNMTVSVCRAPGPARGFQ